MTALPSKESSPIGVTMGEPSGIGGEITLKAWQARQATTHPFFVLDSPERLSRLSADMGLDINVTPISDPSECTSLFDTCLPVLPLSSNVDALPGRPSTKNAIAVVESIDRAFELSKNGTASAVVTNPIQKETLYQANFVHPGHTEYLAHLDGADVTPVMMLASPILRVVPVTVHVSLADAIASLTQDLIVEKSEITIHAMMRDYNIARPRIAIAGLNPHAGEKGTIGDHEIRIIQPAIERLRQSNNADIVGPVPPDALFTPRARGTYDVAICMYHDQALIPIKALDFDRAVNVTLGLSVVRTSPDHGTALDIAGKGVAEPTSLLSAIAVASEIAAARSARSVTSNG